MDVESLYSLAEAIVDCAKEDALLTKPDPARGLFTRKEAEYARKDAEWFFSEIRGRMSFQVLDAVWETILERRQYAPITPPLFPEEYGPKRCLKCGLVKAEVEFGWMPNLGTTDGFCRSCRAEHMSANLARGNE